MKEYRCPDCGKLLFKSDATVGTVELRCPGCRVLKQLTTAHK